MTEEFKMNIDKVNSVVSRAISQIQAGEVESLSEMMMGGVTPSGDPERGGDGGVDNAETSGDQFDAYIEQSATAIMTRCDCSADDAIDYLLAAADEAAEAGTLGPIPDPDSSTAEDLATWAGAAKTVGLVARAIEMAEAEDED